MKTVYYILLCCSCLVLGSCQPKNKKAKTDLNVSLLFYPTGVIENPRYSIHIDNDSLIVNNYSIRDIYDITYCKIKLDEDQLQKINRMVLDIKTHFSSKDISVLDTWGVQLKIDDQIVYEADDFSFNSPPEDIKALIKFLVSLSPIPIELYGFS